MKTKFEEAQQKARIAKQRQEENKDLMERLNRGEPCQRPSVESWYPDRPKIKKDLRAMTKLYDLGKKED